SCPVEVPHPDQFRQRLMQERGGVGGRQRAEQRDGGGGAPVPGGLDRDEMHGQRVARLGPFDVEGARLRIEVGELAYLRDQVVLPAHPAGEAVFGEHLKDRGRRDAYGRRGATECPGGLPGSRPEGDDLDVAHVSYSSSGSRCTSPTSTTRRGCRRYR